MQGLALDTEVVLVRLLADPANAQDPRTPPCLKYVVEMRRDLSTEVLREQAKISRVQLSDAFLFQFALEWWEPCRFQGRRFATLSSGDDLDEARLVLAELGE